MRRKYMYVPFNGVTTQIKRVDPIGDAVSAAIAIVGTIWTIIIYL